MTTFPRMVRIRQAFERPLVSDILGTVQSQLHSLALSHQVKSGQTVAVTVGSRGITNIAVITKAVVDFIKSLGAIPIIIPAMGSHGGATAEGQRKVIEDFGVTEAAMGAEIRSSMETVIVDRTTQGIDVHFDKHAFAADHVIVMGRVKPHTGFVGDVESGLHKMMLIGLGKHAGALLYHRAVKSYSFGEIIQSVADVVIAKCSVLCGLAIVENAFDETALIEAVAPHNFFERESALLKQAVAWMPSLPVSEIDLLIIDRIGKDISGTGMDTNIIGRKFNDHSATEKDAVSCKRIFIRGLTENTKGNATGIGLAEFTLQSCVDEIDMEKTRINCVTSSHPTAGMIPLVYATDAEAMTDALKTIGLTEPHAARIVHIRDTLHLDELSVSESIVQSGLPQNVSIMGQTTAFPLDSMGTLASVTIEG